ncbi:MAG: hypothetical protein AB7K35_03610 [Pseudorhodoplanes sp.]
MAEAQLVERLRAFLQELKPEARSLLIAELEKSLLRGEETPGAELVLQELRRSMRETSKPAPRGGSLSRLFFQPLEPFLVDDEPGHKHPGRIARGALDPIWQWICRDLMPGETKAVAEEVARAYAEDDAAKAEQLARAFQDRAIVRIAEAQATASRDEKTLRKLAAQIGTPRAIDDITAICAVVGARDKLSSLGKRMQGHIRNLADHQLDLVKTLLENSKLTEPSLFVYALVLVMGRLAAPWQLIRLAIRSAGSDQASKVAETPYAPAVAIVLAEIERTIRELRAELRSGRGVATGALLKSIHDAARGLRTELELSVESPWGRRLADLRAQISELLTTEIESMPGRVRRQLRPRSDKEVTPGMTLDLNEVKETETLLEFVGSCRIYASELAVSEVTQRAYTELQQYLDTTTRTLIDGLRGAGEPVRAFRQSQFQAAVQFCGKMFGPEYASLLLKAAEVATGAERKLARA